MRRQLSATGMSLFGKLRVDVLSSEASAKPPVFSLRSVLGTVYPERGKVQCSRTACRMALRVAILQKPAVCQ